MKFTVDQVACSGQGRCYSLYAEVYSDDEAGFNTDRGRTVDVPENLQEAARLGALICPEGAITITEV
jgi:ferredoxin